MAPIFKYHGTTYVGPKAWRGGVRLVVLYQRGHKWLRLLDVATLDVYMVPLVDERIFKPADDTTVRSVRRAILKQRATFKRYKVPFRRKATKAALIALQEAA